MHVVRSILAGALALALVALMIPLPAAAIMPLAACEQKCKSAYEETAAKCGKMENQAEKRACDDSGYATYKSCRTDCEKHGPDCLEHCKEQCEKQWEQCRDNCPKKGDGVIACKEKCMRELSGCLNECDKRCK
jgi:hypothetical protein